VRRRDRLAKLEANRNSLVDRLQKLHHEVGIHAVSQDPQVQLSQLAAALAGQREMVLRRRDLQKEERDLRKQLGTDLQELRRLRRRRESLFAEARVTDEDELRVRVGQIERAADLGKRKQRLTDQITSLVGGHCADEQIEKELDGYNPENLKRRWDDLVTRLHDSQTHLGQLHQRRGEINQEMKSLAENRRLSAARFELSAVRQQLDEAASQWRTAATTWHVLEHVRETYEAERQPETLDEASMYLERLTRGKHNRVWTPLGRHELRVDDQQGKPLPLDVLSRGTREAVFLSLRLALVASYGRRGVNIPMVLDDVLVNLDAQRAEAAVELLCDYSRGTRVTRQPRQHQEPAPVAVAPEPPTQSQSESQPELQFVNEPEIVDNAVDDLVFAEPMVEEPTFPPMEELDDEEAIEEELDEEYVLSDADGNSPLPTLQLGDFDDPVEEELPLKTDASVEAALDEMPEEEPEEEAEDEVDSTPLDDVDELFAEQADDEDHGDGPWWSFDHGFAKEETAA